MNVAPSEKKRLCLEERNVRRRRMSRQRSKLDRCKKDMGKQMRKSKKIHITANL